MWKKRTKPLIKIVFIYSLPLSQRLGINRGLKNSKEHSSKTELLVSWGSENLDLYLKISLKNCFVVIVLYNLSFVFMEVSMKCSTCHVSLCKHILGKSNCVQWGLLSGKFAQDYSLHPQVWRPGQTDKAAQKAYHIQYPYKTLLDR